LTTAIIREPIAAQTSRAARGKTLVVIPAYNEADSIAEVVTRGLKFADVCVVNDASKDRTGEIVASIPGAVCITHVRNTHIPGAIRDGMSYADKHGYDYVVTMDAGLTHLPEELPRFINAPPADLVIGRRTKTANVPRYRKLVSFCASVLYRIALRPLGSSLPPLAFHDVTSGYRRYSRAAVKLLLSKRFKARTFDFIPEALMFVYRNRMSIIEVPISYEFSNSSFNWRVLRTGIGMFADILVSRRS
jgi:dolichol-phosphate mannosyltransferase